MDHPGSLFRKLYGSQLPLRTRLDNILFTFGVLVGVLGAIACILIQSTTMATVLAAASAVLLLLLWIFGSRDESRRDHSILAALLVAMFVILPALYLSGGSIYSGISAYFALGLALSGYLVRGRRGLILMAFECLYIAAIYYLSFRFRGQLIEVPAMEGGRADTFHYLAVGSNVIMVCLALVLLARAIFSLYRQENHTVEESIVDMTRRSTIDPLTSLYNRRFLYECMEQAVQQSDREHTPLSVLLFDIDDFKKVNDHYGHAAGDEALQTLASLLNGHRPASGVAARYGGEEFLLLLPGFDQADAALFAEQMRSLIERSVLAAAVAEKDPITVSVGVVEYQSGMTCDDLVYQADRCMYEAKRRGKNRVVS